ncbi:MAG: hypothetical protein ACRD92_07420 [Nitrosopumilaceae archaeon]
MQKRIYDTKIFLVSSIIVALVFSSGLPSAQSLIMGHPLEFWDSADIILDGVVISSSLNETDKLVQHDVKVEQYFKNPKPQKMITVYGPGVDNEDWFYPKFFKEGERALFYLKKVDDKYIILEHSIAATEKCDPRDMIGLSTLPGEPIGRGGPILFFDPYQTCNGYLYSADYLSKTLKPSKQFEAGIKLEDIWCEKDHAVIVKIDGSPACVNYQTKSKLIQRGWASLNQQINSKLLPVKPLRVSYEEFAGSLMGIKGDTIIEKQESESKIIFITNMGNIEINKGLKSPVAIYTIHKNPVNISDIHTDEYSKLILENIGYTQDGTESITSIGSSLDSKITFTQLVNGVYQNSHHTTFYFSSGYTKIELGRWYQDISKIGFLVSNEDAKNIAYQYMQSEIERNPELQQRNMKAQIPTFSESLQIVDDRIVYYLDAAVGPNNHPEVDSPNYIGVLVDVMTGQVLGWDLAKLEI